MKYELFARFVTNIIIISNKILEIIRESTQQLKKMDINQKQYWNLCIWYWKKILWFEPEIIIYVKNYISISTFFSFMALKILKTTWKGHAHKFEASEICKIVKTILGKWVKSRHSG